jgi:peptidoglycan/xylan/chitin deacetylase (PgdA/CDA1 family)
MRRYKSFTYYISALILVCSLSLIGWNCAQAADQKVFVLCYHSFLGNKRFAGDVSMQELREQMDFFKDKGFQFVSFSDILKGTVKGSHNILIVIDDGNESVYRAYHDIFKPRNIKPVLAIYPSIIGKKSYALTWEQLKGLSQNGCEIASHGYYHLLLNQKLYDKDKAALIKEINDSKEVLEKRLNLKILAMVYPNGVRSDITKKILKEAGYSCAFTIKWGPLLSPLSINKDPFELPRYMIYQNNWGMISNSVIKAAGD